MCTVLYVYSTVRSPAGTTLLHCSSTGRMLKLVLSGLMFCASVHCGCSKRSFFPVILMDTIVLHVVLLFFHFTCMERECYSKWNVFSKVIPKANMQLAFFGLYIPPCTGKMLWKKNKVFRASVLMFIYWRVLRHGPRSSYVANYEHYWGCRQFIL